MASKHEWMVILPDNAGALDKRMQVRGDHLKALVPAAESGFWVLGGAMLDEPIKEGGSHKITGSCMMAVASSKEEVMEQLKKDVYYSSDVWDKEKKIGKWMWNPYIGLTTSQIQIIPFKSAIRKAL